MAASAKAKVAVSGLRAYYFTDSGIVKAVDNIDFYLREGESFSIVGESACGKSSLGNALMRSIQPPGKVVGGSIILRDIDLLKMSLSEFDKKIRWKEIAMIFQGAMNTLDPVYTIGTQLKEILIEHHFDGNIENKISESLREVGLDDSTANRYPHELSGGMKQRVVIAMALLLEPDILIADEPTTALDVLIQSQIIHLLKKLRTEKGITIILITHDLALVGEIADKIGIMYAGQLVEIGLADEIYRKPKHPYTQALIAAIPRLISKEKKISYVKGRPPSLLDPAPGCRFYSRCPYAMDICKRDPPEFPTETGYVRCWLYENERSQR